MIFILRSFSFFVVFGVIAPAHAQPSRSQKSAQKPRLVVLLMVDQMRADLLERFAPAMRKAAQGQNIGLLGLRDNGVEFKNASVASVPSVTAAGHTALCTGANASRHGIVSNSFFDRNLRREVESTADAEAKMVFTSSLLGKDPLSQVAAEGSSARQRKVSSLADALDQFSGGSARAVSVSLKDRGAVYCSGRNSVGTYWYDYKTGSMVSSTAFTRALPQWVDAFNVRSLASRKNSWTSVLPVEEMRKLLSDEGLRKALTIRSPNAKRFGAGLPYELSPSEANGLAGRRFFEYTPAASEYLVDFALEAVRQERLGCASRQTTDECKPPLFPDLLTVSFSTPDLVGHTFGGESVELMDIYLHLNQSVERVVQQLKKELGEKQVLFVLSSDHGVQTLPEVLQARGQKVGRLKGEEVIAAVESELKKEFSGGPWIETISTSEIFFNSKMFVEQKKSREDVYQVARQALLKVEGIRAVWSEKDLALQKSREGQLYLKGHDPARSGDLKILTQPGWLWGSYNAANHGTAFEDDTRIPILFSGWNIARGRMSSFEAYADDVAPTILALLGASSAPSMTGRSLLKEIKP